LDFRDWEHFLHTARPTLDLEAVGHVLCLDPGETTGWALWEAGLLADCGQWATPSPDVLADAIAAVYYNGDGRGPGLARIVYEEYRIRGNKAKEHVGSEVVTIQHVGAIKVVASELAVPLWKQSAGMAKGFATDEKLRRWDLWQPNLRHANDAIRHGVYYHLFVAGRSR
jgi:hypothetical protein